MGRPKASPRVATSERLLLAAEESFGQSGFDRARLSDIAERAGISRPSLLYHFASKEALYEAVVNGAFASLAESFTGALSRRGSFEDRFDELVGRFVAFVDERPWMAVLLLRELVDGRGPGRDILLSAGVPLIDRIERFVRDQGHGIVRAGLPIRAALMHVVGGALVRAAAGPVRAALWGDDIDHTRALARALFTGA